MITRATIIRATTDFLGFGTPIHICNHPVSGRAIVAGIVWNGWHHIVIVNGQCCKILF